MHRKAGSRGVGRLRSDGQFLPQPPREMGKLCHGSRQNADAPRYRHAPPSSSTAATNNDLRHADEERVALAYATSQAVPADRTKRFAAISPDKCPHCLTGESLREVLA